MQINNTNISANKYQMQSAEKMISEAREKRNQANGMHAQADKLQVQAQAQERTGISMKFNAKTAPLTDQVLKQAGAIETMSKVKNMMLEQPQNTKMVHSNFASERVLHLLK